MLNSPYIFYRTGEVDWMKCLNIAWYARHQSGRVAFAQREVGNYFAIDALQMSVVGYAK